jgi:tripeptide aminopeptidase
VEPATPAEKARLADTFVRLCEIESPSGREAEVAGAVRSELEAAGLEVAEDGTAEETGAGCGNLLARIPPPDGAPSIVLCAHLDTVPLTGPVEVELSGGAFRNRHDAILGADNKAAVAVIVEAARRFAAASAPVGLDLLFTASEENGLRGARAFDLSRVGAQFGFVFDHATPIGELIVAAPTHYSVVGDFLGRAAHAGIRPEDGRSAIDAAARAIGRMPLGRIDERTTANVGVIEGGTAGNVVPERCRVECEVRSLDDETAGAAAKDMVDALGWAAGATETDVDTVVEEHFRAYRIPESDPCVAAASAALRDCGIEPVTRSTGGGSDASVFEARGLRCVNVANGTEANHTSDESVAVAALETMLDVVLRLVARSAEV